jgi:hypothetical protein
LNNGLRLEPQGAQQTSSKHPQQPFDSPWNQPRILEKDLHLLWLSQQVGYSMIWPPQHEDWQQVVNDWQHRGVSETQ